jgi:hypothetical protein
MDFDFVDDISLVRGVAEGITDETEIAIAIEIADEPVNV